MESVGHLDSPNLETIAALKPDLILGAKGWDSQNNYKLLSQIAPTVIAEVETSGEWKKKIAEQIRRSPRKD
ncbi:ABC transporter substrate-binding protein [Myxosarcina sp. GI1(2024)]